MLDINVDVDVDIAVDVDVDTMVRSGRARARAATQSYGGAVRHSASTAHGNVPMHVPVTHSTSVNVNGAHRGAQRGASFGRGG